MSSPAPPETSFTSADEAMDTARAALGYLTRVDVASLPGVTQARLLRELERAESQHTAARARTLSAFTAQCGYEADGLGSPRSWLVYQTQVSGKAASTAVGWMHRLAAHPVVGDALATGSISASYARHICTWAGMLPLACRDAAAQILIDAALDGADLDDLSRLAEEMFARLAPPDHDDDRGFGNRFFRLSRLFQGHGRADGDLTPECLAALQEVLDTLAKKAGPEDDRTAGQRHHDALEEAMRLLLASGCLPERAGQPAQVQLHLTLDELLGMPGAADAARAWLASHLGNDAPVGSGQPAHDGADSTGHPDPSQPHGDPAGSGTSGGDASPAHRQDASPHGDRCYPGDSNQPGTTTSSAGPTGHPGPGQPGRPGQLGTSSASGRPDLDDLLWPDPYRTFSKTNPAVARRAAGAGERGWLTGKAAEAYACDAKIAPMVCGHLDRNALARAVTDLLAGDLANLVSATNPMPMPGPRCECDEHPRVRRAPIPGALPTTGLPGLRHPGPAAPGAPATSSAPDAASRSTTDTSPTDTGTATGGPLPLGLTAPDATTPSRAALTPGGLGRLQDTLLRYAVSLLSGPTGLAAYLRTELTGGFFPAASLPLDLGQPTEEVPPHLRRAVIKRDRHCSFPGCSLPPVRCHVHHLIPRSKGGPTRLDNLTLLCAFHHLVVIHRKGWTLTLHGDGTTTAKSPDGIRTLHSHGPPPEQDTLWSERSSQGPPATAA